MSAKQAVATYFWSKTGGSLLPPWDADAWTDERKKKDGTAIKPCSMKRATDLLRSYSFEVKAVLMPPGRDPGSYPFGSPELKDILALAKTPKFK